MALLALWALPMAVFAKEKSTARGWVCLPSDNVLHELLLAKKGGTYKLASDPFAGKVEWKIQAAFEH